MFSTDTFSLEIPNDIIHLKTSNIVLVSLLL